MNFSMIFLVVFSFVASIDLESPVIDLDMIQEINNDPSSGWKAGINEVFVGKTYSDIIHLFRPLKIDENNIQDNSRSQRGKVSSSSLPTHYDVYEQFPKCKLPIRDQGQCGDDLKFALVEILSDRICVAKKGNEKVVLSPQVSCSLGNTGCQGAYLSKDLDYLHNTGVVTEECFPYTSSGGDVPKCPYKCSDHSLLNNNNNNNNWNSSKHKIKDYRRIPTMEEAMEELMNSGPFFVDVDGYEDFIQYKSGVYYHRTGGALGSHAMKVQGFGVDSSSGLPYWNCALAWTTKFGLDGYMWFLRGKNECQFEDYMWSMNV